ncbi:ATP-dependent DNA ligase [Streptomyces avermitilis]|uniref:ATP-dependent DNA ligase n=1 Tax=Streptomyces avermitilis TaxID=33903 RepID=UPI003677E222
MVSHRPRRETPLLQYRRGSDLTLVFPDIAAAAASALGKALVLDGELVVPHGGRLDFPQLQNRARRRGPSAVQAAARRPAHLIVFDLLEADGSWPRPSTVLPSCLVRSIEHERALPTTTERPRRPRPPRRPLSCPTPNGAQTTQRLTICYIPSAATETPRLISGTHCGGLSSRRGHAVLQMGEGEMPTWIADDLPVGWWQGGGEPSMTRFAAKLDLAQEWAGPAAARADSRGLRVTGHHDTTPPSREAT